MSNCCSFLSYEIDKDSVDLLGRIIETFLTSFNEIHPNRFVPKFHFLLHIVRNIIQFGPGRQQWCFRFELADAYFKSLVPVTHNIKNMAKSLCYRHQARLCSKLVSYPGFPATHFLYRGDYITPGKLVLVNELAHKTYFIGTSMKM